jgi:large exoprotein involved in heme utilization and adhesion
MRPHRNHSSGVRHLIFGLALCLAIPCSVSLAQEGTPITSTGLNTTVSAPITLPSGETQFDITGGTRPGGEPNLFHSFGNFNVPNNNIANFLNNSGLATSNILGRVTGGISPPSLEPSKLPGSGTPTSFS